MFDKLFSHTNTLQKGLDATALRSKVINNNIANAETPGFKSSSVDFETHFRNALLSQGSFETKQTRSKHIDFNTSLDSVTPMVHVNNKTSMRMDGNNVDIDYENAELAKNALMNTALIEKLNGEFRRLRMAIREGS